MAMLRPEPEMKDSGIEWVGQIPKGWTVIPNKYLMHKEKDLCAKWTGEDVMSLTMNGVVIRDLVNPSGKMPESFDGYQYIKNGDLLMCLFDIDVTPRCVGRVFHDGVTSPAYSNFKLHESVSLGYYYYYYLMLDHTKELLHLAKNLRHSFTAEQLGQLKVPRPSYKEQQAIAAYLDDRCAKLDEIVTEAEKSIEEYKELKQAVIFEAVTKGLDKKVPMKDSGIDFLGSIPAHWKITQLKRICERITDGSHFSPETVSDGMPYVTAGDVHGKGINYETCRRISNKDFASLVQSGCRPQKGDVLLVKDGATTGRVGLMTDNEECVLLSSVAMLTPINRISSEYLMYLLESNVMQYQIKKSMAGSAMPRTTLTKLMSYMAIDCPLNEQLMIVDYLNSMVLEYDALISEKQSLIEDLKAYKKSLIYEVVTGKRRVV